MREGIPLLSVAQGLDILTSLFQELLMMTVKGICLVDIVCLSKTCRNIQFLMIDDSMARIILQVRSTSGDCA